MQVSAVGVCCWERHQGCMCVSCGCSSGNDTGAAHVSAVEGLMQAASESLLTGAAWLGPGWVALAYGASSALRRSTTQQLSAVRAPGGCQGSSSVSAGVVRGQTKSPHHARVTRMSLSHTGPT